MTIEASGYDRGDTDHPINGIPNDVIGRALRDTSFLTSLLQDPGAVNADRQADGLELMSGPAVKMLEQLDLETVLAAMAMFPDEAISAK